MLNLNCVICAELFAHSDDVHITHCGHMFHYPCLSQWLQRSKTCPQCRNSCNERKILRVYFNLANLDTSRIDIGSLQEQLDNSKLELQVKEKELKKAEEQIKSLKDSQKKCMKTITGLEEKLSKNDFVLLSYHEQIKILKHDAKIAADLRKEVKSLTQQLQLVESVNCMISASSAEAESLLKTENDPKTLSILVTTLKRELRNSDKKKHELQNMLHALQTDLRREKESKRVLKEHILDLESECYRLSEKLMVMESSMPSTSKSLHEISESSSNRSLYSVKVEEKHQTISHTIKESVRKIEESDSPYLNIKSSSVGLMPYAFKRNKDFDSNRNVVKTTTKVTKIKVSPNKSTSTQSGLVRKMSSDLTEKYSILKKPRLVLRAPNTVGGPSNLKKSSSNLVFNGLGGSEKIDPFQRQSSDDDYDDDDDDVHIVDDKNGLNKNTGSVKSNKSNTKSNVSNLKKSNSAPGLSLNDRVKSGGLRNFKLSNRQPIITLKKAHLQTETG